MHVVLTCTTHEYNIHVTGMFGSTCMYVLVTCMLHAQNLIRIGLWMQLLYSKLVRGLVQWSLRFYETVNPLIAPSIRSECYSLRLRSLKMCRDLPFRLLILLTSIVCTPPTVVIVVVG